MFSWIHWRKPKPLAMKKFLIVGLGNIGDEYAHTRHNIGFDVVDALAQQWECSFDSGKSASIARKNYRGKTFVLIKPTTFMNRSGKAVRYWALKENIPLQNILIVTDDLHLPFGSLRLRGKGSSGGHNGLKDIESQLNTNNYSRLRFGIGQAKGEHQVDFVLGKWTATEADAIPERIQRCQEMIISFAVAGLQNTMNQFNGS